FWEAGAFAQLRDLASQLIRSEVEIGASGLAAPEDPGIPPDRAPSNDELWFGFAARALEVGMPEAALIYVRRAIDALALEPDLSSRPPDLRARRSRARAILTELTPTLAAVCADLGTGVVPPLSQILPLATLLVQES